MNDFLSCWILQFVYFFVEQGYKETSITAIAASAGVAPQTVYAAFGSKSGIILGIIRNIRENKQFRARYMETQKTSNDQAILRKKTAGGMQAA